MRTLFALAILVATWVEGDYRYCKYEVSPGKYKITTIEAVDICPLDL